MSRSNPHPSNTGLDQVSPPQPQLVPLLNEVDQPEPAIQTGPTHQTESVKQAEIVKQVGPVIQVEQGKLIGPVKQTVPGKQFRTAKQKGERNRSAARSAFTRFAAAVRWLHIYVSLLGFSALVFFAVTGITLNHPEWFAADIQRVVEHKGTLKLDWLRDAATQKTSANDALVESLNASEDGAEPANSGEEQTDDGPQVSKFEIVEFLRATHRIRGAVGEFRADDYECLILFKGPGYSADTVINRESGAYTITETFMGVIAVINDLHKGRDSGPVWFWVIDLTALLMIFVSVTGIILIFYLKRKRFTGIVTAVVGTILFAAVYYWCP